LNLNEQIGEPSPKRIKSTTAASQEGMEEENSAKEGTGTADENGVEEGMGPEEEEGMGPEGEEEKEPVKSSRQEKTPPRFTANQVNCNFISFDLNLRLKKDGVLAAQDMFASEAASYLLIVSLIASKEGIPAAEVKPPQKEYEIFCTKMVEFYSDLKSNIGKYDWVCIIISYLTTLSVISFQYWSSTMTFSQNIYHHFSKISSS